MTKDWTARQLAAECMATALLTWAGTGSAVASNDWTEEGTLDPARLLGIAVCFGCTVSVLAYGIGHISGGHMNPAVALAFVVIGEQSVVGGLLYMLAQCLGAIIGSFLLWGCTFTLADHCAHVTGIEEHIQEFKSSLCAASLLEDGGYGPAYNLGANSINVQIGDASAFLFELIGTFLLVITVLNSAVAVKSAAGNAAPIAIGWAVLVAHVVLIPYTSCGINPARSLGPMVVDAVGGAASKVWVRNVWVFYAGPFAGSLLAAATYTFIFEETDVEAEAKTGDDAGSGEYERLPIS